MSARKIKKTALLATAIILTGCAAHLATAPTTPTDKAAAEIVSPAESHPVYVSKMPLTKYTLFATGGWDGNWYVGSNQAWIEKINLSRYKKSDYARAYIGAKLGRMKSKSDPGKPSWERTAYPGEIYAAASSTPAWTAADYTLIARTSDIPLQYDYENAVETVGEARWFWAEYSLEKLNFDGDNYIALWSPNEYFDSVSSAPVLAAAWGDKEIDSWLNTSLGAWPHLSSEDPLKTPISVFEPAIAVKLVPRRGTDAPTVDIVSVEDTRAGAKASKKITAAVSGRHAAEKSWLETSKDAKSYLRISRFVYEPPYVFVFDPAISPDGKIYLRVAAENIRGETGYSKPLEFRAEK